MNAIFVIALAGAVAQTGLPLLGAVSLAASAAVIDLRGYPMPRTPTLTQRYLPSWAMAHFEHRSTQTILNSHPEPADVGDCDRNNVLVEHGVLVPCDGGADLCLADAVRRTQMDALDAISADVDTILSESTLVDTESSELVADGSVDDFAVFVDGVYVGRWPSREVFLADATGAVTLASELPG